MSTLYNEYLTGAEREAAIIVAESEAQFTKLNILFEAVDATLEANMYAAEAKVLAENGTYEDLTMLYTEAEKDASQKKQGLIATILNAIGNLFASIGKFLNEKFGKKLENLNNIPDEVKNVPVEMEKKINIFQKAWNMLKGPVDLIRNENSTNTDIAKGWAGITAEFTALAGATAGTVVCVKKREEIVNWIKNVIGPIRAKVQDAINTLVKKLKHEPTEQPQPQTQTPDNKPVEAPENTPDNKVDDKQEAPKTSEAQKPLSTFWEWLKGTVGKSILDALKWLGGKIMEFIGQLGSLIGLNKKQSKNMADNKGDANNAPANTPAEQTAKESASVLGIDLDTDDVLLESVMSDEGYDELCELFADL